MQDQDVHRWRPRPVAGGAVRHLLLLLPVAASIGVVLVLAPLLPTGAARTPSGLILLLALAFAVAVVVERLTRRFFPVAVLLGLSMVFADRAPSRLRLLRRAARGTPPPDLVWTGPGAVPARTDELALRLVAAITAHDRRTRGHSERVRAFAELLASELHLDADDRERLRWAALLHDVGKLAVSQRVLNKPGPLDRQEYDVIKEHPALGAAHIAPLQQWLGEWAQGVADHHERYDGTGYPAGRSGTEISLAGRLLAVVDAFETMTSARPYKKAFAARTARVELARCAGSHFDPALVRAFLAISLPRLLWAMGPLAFLAQLPVLRQLADTGARVGVTAPQTALATGAAGAAAVLTATAPGAVAAAAEPLHASPSTSSALAAEHPLVLTADGSDDASGQPVRRGLDLPPVSARHAAPAPVPADAGSAPAPPPAPAPTGTDASAPPAPVETRVHSASAPSTARSRPSTSGAPMRAASTDQPMSEAAPLAQILSAPPLVTTATSATFRMAPLPTGLECMVTGSGSTRGGAPSGVRPCSTVFSISGLRPGTWTFRVRPADGSRWATFTWTVIG